MHEVARACTAAICEPSALALGTEGELVEIGVQVAQGYIHRTELSAAKFGVVQGAGAVGMSSWGGRDGQGAEKGGRFYRSGDVVKVTEQGLMYVGRSDSQVKVQGMRCELGEIESVLRSSGLVQDAVVRVDETTKSFTMAFILLALPLPPAALHPDLRAALHMALDQCCRRQLPATICPRHYYAVSKFPTIPSGKVDRTLFTSDAPALGIVPLWELSDVGVGGAEGGGGRGGGGGGGASSEGLGELMGGREVGLRGMEGKVAGVWRSALGLPEHVSLRKTDSFFLCGGDSLAALSVVKRLVQWSQSLSPRENAPFQWPEDGVVQGPLSVKHLLGLPTLADYAAHLEASAVRLPHPDDDAQVAGQGGHGEHAAGQSRDVDTGGGVGEGMGEEGGLALSFPVQCALNALYLVAQGEGCEGGGGGVLVRALCDLGAPADGIITRKSPGTAPLHVAAAAGNLAVVTALLEAGATVNLINPTHVTAVQLSAASSAPVLQVLLDAGAPVRVRDAAKQTLLHHASRGGNAAAITLLIARGALPDINIADKWNRQPLHWAVLNGHRQAVEALLACGADAQPAQVPDRVHRRRTSLVAETPAQLALRVHGPGSILDALVNSVRGGGKLGGRAMRGERQQDRREGEGGSHLHRARAAHCVERVDTHEIRMLISHTTGSCWCRRARVRTASANGCSRRCYVRSLAVSSVRPRRQKCTKLV